MGSKENEDKKKPEKRETDETIAAEGTAAYNLDQSHEFSQGPVGKDFPVSKGRTDQELKLLLAPSQLASTSEGGDHMSERYFEKFIDQKLANIDEKFTNIKEENARIREELHNSFSRIHRSLEQALSEMRERDNQRHAEIIAMEAKMDERLEKTLAKKRELNKQRHAGTLPIEAKLDAAASRMEAKLDGLNKWIFGFIVATFLMLVGTFFSLFSK